MEKTYKVQTRFLFHTNIRIKIPSTYEDGVFDKLYEILEMVNKNYNSYSEGSYIDKINKNSGEFVEVDNETIEMLEKIIYYSDKLNGEYDITIMPLIRIWGFYKKNMSEIPKLEELKEAQKLVDYKKIIIDKENRKVKIDRNQEIITGSFIKSYAIDKMVKKMKELGIEDAIVNAGGSSIIAINDWDIIVENPKPEKELKKEKFEQAKVVTSITDNNYRGDDEYNDLFEITIKNESYSTSNQVNTFLTINGQKYGHIISPKTCYPGENLQVGIVTESAFLGDIISTGMYNQTPEKFLEILKTISKEIKIEGYLIDKYGKIHYSNRFVELLKK